MAFPFYCAAPPSSQLLLGFRRSFTTPRTAIFAITASTLGSKPSPIYSNFRFSAAARLQIKQSLSTVFASKLDPSDGKEIADDAPNPQGPPLLTILAGLAVFFLVFWISGSIITGLIGFIVKLFTFK